MNQNVDTNVLTETSDIASDKSRIEADESTGGLRYAYICSLNLIDNLLHATVYPRSSYPFYIVSYYIKWVTTCWIYSTGYFDTSVKFRLRKVVRGELELIKLKWA